MGPRRSSVTRSIVTVAVLAVVLALAGATLFAGPAGAHTNHVAADAQVVADGTVVVESVFAADDAWLAIRADDGGEPGAVLGARQVDGDAGFRTDVGVALADGWADGAPSTAWAVLHTTDGDGEFDPADDEPIESFGSLAGERFALEPGDRPGVVTAEQFSPQAARDGTVTVRRVSLPADGHLAIHADDDGPGSVVGNRSLSAGTHRNVSVAVAPSALAGEDATALWAVVHTDDRDGALDDGDEPLRVGDGVVGTRFAATGGPEATATDEAAGDASPTDSDASVETTAASPSPGTTDTGNASTAGASDGAGPGVGPLGVLVAVLIAVAVLARRRGRA